MSATTMESQMTALAAKLEGVVQFTYLHGPHAVEATPLGVVPLPPRHHEAGGH